MNDTQSSCCVMKCHEVSAKCALQALIPEPRLLIVKLKTLRKFLQGFGHYKTSQGKLTVELDT